MSENENPMENEEQFESESNERESRGGRGGMRGNRNSGGARARGKTRRRRGKTYYCPKGKCFDYKDLDTLNRYVNESGKIKPRRQTGNCSRCQRELAREIKRARHLALMSFIDAD